MELMNYQRIMVLNKIIFTIFPALLVAGNIDLSLENYNGESSYIVEKPELALKSKLDFPFKFNTIGILAQTDILDFDIYMKSNFILNSKSTIGKDYDWQNNDLTVLSNSNNQIDKFRDFTIGINKNLTDNLKLTNKLNYNHFDISWKDTIQENFITGRITRINNETLKYEQDILKYNLGLNYRIDLLKDLSLNIEPSLIYAYIDSKDSHLMRNFYTTQYSNAIGFGGKTTLKHKITENFEYDFFFNYEEFKDKSTNMNYYNEINNNLYATLPASFEYKNQILGFTIRYKY